MNVCFIICVEPKSIFYCTKCHKRFKEMPDLHKHMLTCADPETMRPKYVWVYQYRKQKYSKMKKKRTCGWQKNMGAAKKFENDLKTLENGDNQRDSMDRDSLTNNEMGGGLDASQDGFDDVKKRRKKAFEVTYNPTRHTRRREMTEIVDTSICGGCGDDFKTISLLERHIPVCLHKEKIRDLEHLKSVHEAEYSADSDASDEFDPSKHHCIYCLREFKFMRSLRNHIFEICSVRKELVEKKEYIDEEWEKDIVDKTGAIFVGKCDPFRGGSRGRNRRTPLGSASAIATLSFTFALHVAS